MLIFGVLITVAFIILLERKVLGYIQIRKGPNKVGFLGIIQSLGDAIKLFIKEQRIPNHSNILPYYSSPIFFLLITLFIWLLIPLGRNLININLGILLFFCCTRFSVYTLIGRGWSSNSNYSIIGAIRGVAQTISYEVRIILIFLSVIFLLISFNFIRFSLNQEYFWIFLLIIPLFLCWIVSSLAETNRTPFDFAEGESELVSGFNVEYRRGGFALLFLSEYTSIIFISYIIILVYLGGLNIFIFYILKGLFICYLFIWLRGTLPRFRYDKLISLAWKKFLPISLIFIFLYLLFIYLL